MVAGRVRAAGVMLAAGLFLLAAGCSGPAAKIPRLGSPPTAGGTAGIPAVPPAGFPAASSAPSRPSAPTAWSAVYSAANGHLIRKRTRAVTLGYTFSVFLDHDSEVVGRTGTGTGLEVLRMPSKAVTAYPAPRGCRYQPLAGTQTETELVAFLQCGPGDELSVVAVSPRTFTVTRTLIRLGSCLGGETISLAPADPSAMLAEIYDACLSRVAPGGYTIVKIRDGRAWFVTSAQDMPQGASW